jgi:hypothetical protein
MLTKMISMLEKGEKLEPNIDSLFEKEFKFAVRAFAKLLGKPAESYDGLLQTRNENKSMFRIDNAVSTSVNIEKKSSNKMFELRFTIRANSNMIIRDNSKSYIFNDFLTILRKPSSYIKEAKRILLAKQISSLESLKGIGTNMKKKAIVVAIATNNEPIMPTKKKIENIFSFVITAPLVTEQNEKVVVAWVASKGYPYVASMGNAEIAFQPVDAGKKVFKTIEDAILYVNKLAANPKFSKYLDVEDDKAYNPQPLKTKKNLWGILP